MTNPKDAKIAWYNKGIALEALGNDNEANAAFAKAKELGYVG
jgi:Flp pilus assembly protein TadD